MQILSANDVANFILANQNNLDITNRKLQKLLYYCQSLYLKEEGTVLFSDKIEAWEYGPVCSSVYHKWKEYGYKSLPKVPNIDITIFSEKSMEIIFLVIATFGNYHPDKLIEMSHIDAPWATHYVKNQNNVLTDTILKDYFSNFETISDYEEYSEKKLKYASLISDRKSYLNGLIDLGDDWISPESFAPNETSIFIASLILSKSSEIINQYVKKIPKLIIGPIPSGGVGIEFISPLNNKFFVNIYNNKYIEIDIENNEHFTEYELNNKEIKEKFEELYKEFV